MKKIITAFLIFVVVANSFSQDNHLMRKSIEAKDFFKLNGKTVYGISDDTTVSGSQNNLISEYAIKRYAMKLKDTVQLGYLLAKFMHGGKPGVMVDSARLDSLVRAVASANDTIWRLSPTEGIEYDGSLGRIVEITNRNLPFEAPPVLAIINKTENQGGAFKITNDVNGDLLVLAADPYNAEITAKGILQITSQGPDGTVYLQSRNIGLLTGGDLDLNRGLRIDSTGRIFINNDGAGYDDCMISATGRIPGSYIKLLAGNDEVPYDGIDVALNSIEDGMVQFTINPQSGFNYYAENADASRVNAFQFTHSVLSAINDYGNEFTMSGYLTYITNPVYLGDAPIVTVLDTELHDVLSVEGNQNTFKVVVDAGDNGFISTTILHVEFVHPYPNGCAVTFSPGNFAAGFSLNESIWIESSATGFDLITGGQTQSGNLVFNFNVKGF
ncbi:MAG TPA: hypothetical protein PKC39_14470 [Ferruginibacter sp.]|nr:hypothetical protein [Ferruginibacter sp.]HMP22160.1 hypothetical protein [Ferruginibacter sp.]